MFTKRDFDGGTLGLAWTCSPTETLTAELWDWRGHVHVPRLRRRNSGTGVDMFTYQDFDGGTLGLAWTGDVNNAGGVCERNGVRTM